MATELLVNKADFKKGTTDESASNLAVINKTVLGADVRGFDFIFQCDDDGGTWDVEVMGPKGTFESFATGKSGENIVIVRDGNYREVRVKWTGSGGGGILHWEAFRRFGERL